MIEIMFFVTIALASPERSRSTQTPMFSATCEALRRENEWRTLNPRLRHVLRVGAVYGVECSRRRFLT